MTRTMLATIALTLMWGCDTMDSSVDDAGAGNYLGTVGPDIEGIEAPDEDVPTVHGDDVSAPDEDAGIPDEDAGIPDEDVTLPGEDVTLPDEDVTLPGEDAGILDEDATATDAPTPDEDATDPECTAPTNNPGYQSPHCPEGFYCKSKPNTPEYGVCAKMGHICTQDGHCAYGQECVDGYCAAVPCDVDDECEEGAKCYQGLCTEEVCLTFGADYTDGCAGLYICSHGQCEKPECKADVMCPEAAPFCTASYFYGDAAWKCVAELPCPVVPCSEGYTCDMTQKLFACVPN